MKIIFKMLFFAVLITAVSCNDLLQVNSTSFVNPEDNTYKNARDTAYQTFGILAKIQKLAEPTIILGELRADLMDVTENSNVWLRQISNHEVTEDNPYINV